jgi:hypothetical protein
MHQLVLMLALLAVQTPAPVVPTGRGAVAGRVVDSGSGRPLAEVMMTLQALSTRAELRTVTDENGRFLFEGVGPGFYRMVAARDGYAAQSWSELQTHPPANGIRLTTGQVTVVVSNGQLRSGVNFAMEREGVLTGRVTSSDGQPAKDVTVLALPVLEDPPQMPITGQARTNDRGEYRIGNLPSAMYRVSATYVDRDRARALSGAGPQPTYFPGTHSLEEATSLRVTAGSETRNVDIRLLAADLFRIAGHVLRGSSDGSIEANLLSGEHSIRTVHIAEDGAFDIPLVKPGRHVFWARARTPDSAEAAFTTLDLASDVTGLVLPMMPTAEIRGRVVTADGRAFAAPGYQVIAHLSDPDGRRIDVLPRDRNDILSDGAFELRDLFGHRVFGLSGNEWDVDRVLVGKTDVETLTLNGGERLDGILVVVKPRQR